MENQNIQTSTEIIVAFHIGRGGRFYNAGHKSFIGTKKISEFTNDLYITYANTFDIYQKIAGRENLEELYYTATEDSAEGEAAREKFASLGMDIGEEIYTSSGGNEVGLTVAQAETGIGSINIDHEYDTTYTKYIEDCDEQELKLIENSTEWNREIILADLARHLGYSDLQVKLLENFGNWAEVLIHDTPERYIQDFEVHESEDDLEDYVEYDGKFYTKISF